MPELVSKDVVVVSHDETYFTSKVVFDDPLGAIEIVARQEISTWGGEKQKSVEVEFEGGQVFRHSWGPASEGGSSTSSTEALLNFLCRGPKEQDLRDFHESSFWVDSILGRARRSDGEVSALKISDFVAPPQEVG